MKIRCWHKKSLRYVRPEHYCDFNDGEISPKTKYSNIERFTGCKDHLYTEIYEGDIVFLDAKMLTGEIVMDCYAWKIKTGDSFEWLCDWFEDVQVIGNINQHSDLLEQPE